MVPVQGVTVPTEASRVGTLILGGRSAARWPSLESLVSRQYGMVIGRFRGPIAELAALCRRTGPSVVVADQDFLSPIWMSVEPKFSLGTAARLLVEVNDDAHPPVEPLLRAGCWGFVRSSASARTVAKAVNAVASGQLWLSRSELTLIVRTLLAAQLYGLTPRETEILRLVAQGHRNQQIATCLFISVETVRWHLRAIYSKLGVHDRLSAVLTAFGVLGSGDKPNLRPPEYKVDVFSRRVHCVSTEPGDGDRPSAAPDENSL